MAVPGSVNLMMLGGAPAVYPINQSLRFNSADSYTFRRTPGSDSTSQKKFTVSVWSKRGVIASGSTSNTGRQSIIYTGLSNGSGNLFGVEWLDDEIACIFNGAGTIYPQTVAKFRDPSAWYHIVVAVDTDQATDTDRCRVYVNGVEQTLTGTLPTSGFLVTNGTTSVHTVGELGSLRSNQYLAEAYYINDQQLTPSDFGELNNYGVWVPKEYAGTFTGTNSYYLKFDSAATNGIGHDHSGNGNNFTPSASFNTSGTGTDVMSDTPTTNWCTLNPLTTSNATRDPSDGNLVIAFGGTYPTNVLGTFGLSSGKWYWEVGFAGGDASYGHACGVGVGDWSNKNVDPGGVSSPYHHYIDSRAYFRNSGTNTSNSTGFDPGDTIGIALDVDNNQISFYKNGTIVGSAQSLETGQTWFPLHKNSTSVASLTQTANFGQRDFDYTPPTGFKALNTSNLTEPTVKDGSDYFNAITYSGTITDASSQAVTGVGFQSDFTWIKRRDGSASHQLIDTVRGAAKWLQSDNASDEKTTNVNGALTSFDSDGFTLTGGSTNANECCESGFTYVAWNWKKGVTPGFDIVTYTGNGTNGRQIAHNLGVRPAMYITACRSSTNYWNVWHSGAQTGDASERYQLWLNLTNGRNPAGFPVSTNTLITSTYFTPATLNYDNVLNETYVAYLWSEVPGFSKFGSYTGNGSTDGPFVACNFKPKWLMVKLSTTSGHWVIIDAARNTFNVVDDELVANESYAENGIAITTAVDFTSNGFKIRTSDANLNSNTQTLVFAAFAENPTGGSGVSPATAR